MRTTYDQYKTKEGILINIDQMTTPPKGATIWKGYDYKKQCWIFEGKEDTRTLEELHA